MAGAKLTFESLHPVFLPSKYLLTFDRAIRTNRRNCLIQAKDRIVLAKSQKICGA